MGILLVDDDNILRETMRMFVTEISGRMVEDAENGEVALEKLSLQEFEMMVTDWDMPVMGGEILVQRASKSYPNMRIVVFSGSTIDPSKRLPGIEYLRKPLDHDRLASLLTS